MKYRWDDFLVDLDAYTLERGGTPLSLEPKAFNLLVLLIRRPGHLYTKQEIFDAVWPGTVVTDHALTRVVAQLRRVLKDEAREARYIETVPTRGYRWLPPVHAVSGAIETAPAPQAVLATTPPVRADRWAVLLMVLLAVVSALALNQRAGSTAAPVSRPADLRWPVQLTTSAGLDFQPALSPHGDAVAYVSDRTGGFEIYVRALVGTARETALTQNGGHNVQPTWSPDGKLIAFHSARDGGIWVIPARGGIAKQLVPTGSDPAWSADGRRIAFKSDEHADVTPSAFGAQSGSTLWVVDADGGNLRRLTRAHQPLGGHASPTWTRDGRFVAFTVFEGGVNNGVWVLALETMQVRQLQRGGGMYELAFAPGDAALYAAGGEPLIVRLPFDAKTGAAAGARELIPIAGVASVRSVSVAPDGSRIAFAGLALSSQIWAQPIATDGTPDGDAYPLTSDTSRRNSLPVISPDGSRIAYVSRRAGEPPNIWVMNADGGNPMQVTSDDSTDLQPVWFPDSRRIAFSSDQRNTRGIWTVDISTRHQELLFEGLSKQQNPITRVGAVGEFALSPSLTRAAISVIVPASAGRSLFVTPLPAFAPKPITDAHQWIGYPAWSPDERSLAVEIKDGSDTHAGVVTIETGDLRRITNERGQTWVRSWSPDGRKIAAAAFRKGLWDLRWIDAGSGRDGTITPAAAPRVYMRYPAWSRRGEVIVFERGELRGNIWSIAITP